jgi:hypothetical protein
VKKTSADKYGLVQFTIYAPADVRDQITRLRQSLTPIPSQSALLLKLLRVGLAFAHEIKGDDIETSKSRGREEKDSGPDDRTGN